MSIRRGPAPVAPELRPGERRVVFHFDTGGEAGVNFPESEIEEIRRGVGQAWNSSQGQMFTISRDDGTPSLLVNLAKVRIVEIL
jgi:hypothetical protein